MLREIERRIERIETETGSDMPLVIWKNAGEDEALLLADHLAQNPTEKDSPDRLKIFVGHLSGDARPMFCTKQSLREAGL